MKFFIDTANTEEIQQAADLGVLDGVTTNPSLIAKAKTTIQEVIPKITEITKGPISVEVTENDFEAMVKQGRSFGEFGDNIVVKLPMTRDGIRATKRLSDDGVKVNVTLIFSPLQALLAAKAGATYASPFVGRLDDISQPGMELISQIVTIYENYGYQTEVLVASIRNPIHVVEAALMGADVATIPFDVIAKFFDHPLTTAGLEKFMKDSQSIV